MKRMTALFVSIVLAVVLGGLARAADWPQWRYDAMRSGATEEELPGKLRQQWMLALGRPAPAFEHQYRMCADFSYSPIAAAGMLFVPSNVTDQVMAFELETGALRWRYVTDGPVRFAPIYGNGRVYFSSDDGSLYCVRSGDGGLIWRVRGVPETHPDMRMLVNGRLVSRWPARGAPVLHKGVVYFGTGIWPEEGAFQNAVDAETGRLLWRTDSLSFQKDGMCDHGANYDISLPPQGYPAVINGKLAVASGRTLAAWFDLETGEMDPYTCFYVKFAVPRGAWYVAGNDRFWVQGGNWFASHKEALPEKPASMKSAGSPLSISRRSPGAATYVMENRPFLCSDKPVSSLTGEGRENSFSDWIVTDDTMYATTYGDPENYAVFRGHTFVRRKPMGASFDRLVARDLTRPEWKIYKKPAKKMKGPYALIDFPVKWEMKTPLKAIIKAGGQLIAGDENKVAAIDIPDAGELPLVAWEKQVDGTPVNALVSGGKLVVVTDLGNVYCFGNGLATEPSLPLEPTVEHSPKNGYAFVLGWGDGAGVLELTAGRTDYRLTGSVLARISAPEGAADWTHESAGADNSFVSQDELVQWPLGVLWYSGDIDRFFTPETQYQHDRNPYPLVKGGRLFIITVDKLHAIDVYTGSYLWGTNMPATAYMNGRLMDSRLYGRPTERNYVAAEDCVYSITGDKIRMYSTRSGEDMGALSIPEELRSEAAKTIGSLSRNWTQTGKEMMVQAIPEWTEVRLWNDLLIAMVGRRLVALDRQTGKTQWSRAASRTTITYTLGGDTLYGIDCEPDKFVMDRDQFEKTATLFAMNPQTGEELWSVEFDYPSWVKREMSSLRRWMKPPMPAIGYNAKHSLLIVSYNANNVIAFHARDGAESWRYEDPKLGKFAKFYPPNILDGHLIMTLSSGGLGYLVDIKTGKRLREQCEIPKARTRERWPNSECKGTRDYETLSQCACNRHCHSVPGSHTSRRIGCRSDQLREGDRGGS